MIAGLPMYDLPGLEAHHDRVWGAIGNHLRAAGVDAPSQLTRHEPPTTLWTEPDLLLSQTCGYPLVKHLAGRVRLVATPKYRALGCDGPNHRSLIIVRRNDPRTSLEQFRGARCALNDEASNTGMNLLRAEIAPLMRHGGEAFFEVVTLTGSHSASVDAVAENEADIAALDCVTYALLQRLHPVNLTRIRVLAFTAQTPGLPLIAAASTPPNVIKALQNALDSVAGDQEIKPSLDALLIDGFTQVPAAHYRAVLHTEQIAVTQGYPRLQ
jgi:ABC-type phosphate/phosphonate transport system substrate-binding protein